MPWLVELKITHFRFAIGGEHYYGSLQPRSKWVKTSSGSVTTKGGEDHPLGSITLEKIMSAKLAAYLNKKDDYWNCGSYKKGDKTTRFDTKDEIYEEALKVFRENFTEDDILVIEDGEHLYSGVYIALAGPANHVTALNYQEDNGHDIISDQREYLDKHNYLYVGS